MTNDVTPVPSMIIESLRDFGYTLETAIADIIDNSITANAKTIDVRFSWNNGLPWIAIIDDGDGMTESSLIKAMRFGSQSPSEIRKDDDLGRFGMGLKTASLSQCRRFTVISKKNNLIASKQWDIDLIIRFDKWQINNLTTADIRQASTLAHLFDTYLKDRQSGTIIFWDNMDRLNNGLKYFDSLLANSREHIELVFHRYLEEDLKIAFNKVALQKIDPFFKEKANALPIQEVFCENEKVYIQPYILPHHSRVTTEEYQAHSFGEGYLNSQGFYVYRNKRLIIKGTWFRLCSRSVLKQLARVQIDISNKLDYAWKVDVKKSSAMPPESVTTTMKQVIDEIIKAAITPYEKKAYPIKDTQKCSVWQRTTESTRYAINRTHPMIQVVGTSQFNSCTGEDVLKLIESMFPFDLFFHDFLASPLSRTEQDESDIRVIESTLRSFIALLTNESSTLDPRQYAFLMATEPYCRQRDFVKALLLKEGYCHE